MGLFISNTRIIGGPDWLKLPVGGALAQGSSLLANLVSYWKLEEASGNRVDSVVATGNDLTAVNTPGNAAGIQGNAVAMTAASSQELTHASNASLQTGNIDFTVVCWAYLASLSNVTLGGKYQNAGQKEWALFYNLNDHAPNNCFSLVVSNNGTATTFVNATAFGAPSPSTWCMVATWYNSVAQTLNIQINNGTVNSLSYTFGVFAGTDAFKIGSLAGLNYFMDGRIDEFGFWKRVLTATQLTNLYNAGAGVTYPFTGVP